MARKKDVDWNLSDHNSWESVNAALLMDLRDELKRLNQLLHCGNFLEIPRILRSIRANTKKKPRAKKGTK